MAMQNIITLTLHYNLRLRCDGIPAYTSQRSPKQRIKSPAIAHLLFFFKKYVEIKENLGI